MSLGGRRKRKPATLTDEHRVIALQAASLVLGYPDQDLYTQLPLLRTATVGLPPELGAPLGRMVSYLQNTSPYEAERTYVEVFDLRRNCCLYLTYYAYGDTRNRGMALLRFTHAYKQAGRAIVSGELADHLCVVCEFAATGDLAVGLRLLTENRAGLELMRLALDDLGSPYADALDVVRAVLPDAAPGDLQRALELARTGPPEEEVGLEPFAPPEYMGASRR